MSLDAIQWPPVRVGTIPDYEIIELASRKILISENFDPNCVKQACYELRASEVYYDLSKQAERTIAPTGSYVLVKPRQLIAIITKEALDIPNDVLARILTKGKLFSVGLLPVNTYADPGFVGNLGIVFSNASTNYLKIYPGEPIAKIEFSRLEHPVRRSYHGQHGYQTKIWPVPTDMILSKEEIEKDNRILDVDRELGLSYGPEIPRILSRISRYERPLVIASCFYFAFILLLFILLTKELAIPIGIGVATGIVANVLTSFLTYKATDFLRGKR